MKKAMMACFVFVVTQVPARSDGVAYKPPGALVAGVLEIFELPSRRPLAGVPATVHVQRLDDTGGHMNHIGIPPNGVITQLELISDMDGKIHFTWRLPEFSGLYRVYGESTEDVFIKDSYMAVGYGGLFFLPYHNAADYVTPKGDPIHPMNSFGTQGTVYGLVNLGQAMQMGNIGPLIIGRIALPSAGTYCTTLAWTSPPGPEKHFTGKEADVSVPPGIDKFFRYLALAQGFVASSRGNGIFHLAGKGSEMGFLGFMGF